MFYSYRNRNQEWKTNFDQVSAAVFILGAREKQVQVADEMLVGVMKEAGEFYRKKVPVEIEWSVAENWGEK